VELWRVLVISVGAVKRRVNCEKEYIFGLFDVFCVVMLLRSALLHRRPVVNRKSEFCAIDCGGTRFEMQILLIQGLTLRRSKRPNLWFW